MGLEVWLRLWRWWRNIARICAVVAHLQPLLLVENTLAKSQCPVQSVKHTIHARWIATLRAIETWIDALEGVFLICVDCDRVLVLHARLRRVWDDDVLVFGRIHVAELEVDTIATLECGGV